MIWYEGDNRVKQVEEIRVLAKELKMLQYESGEVAVSRWMDQRPILPSWFDERDKILLIRFIDFSELSRDERRYGLIRGMTEIVDRYLDMHDNAKMLEADIQKLEELGISDFSMCWRKDSSGNHSILELVHKKDSEYFRMHGRRREYVGKNRERIKSMEILSARSSRHGELIIELESLNFKIKRCAELIKEFWFVSGGDRIGKMGRIGPHKNGSE